LRSYVSIFAPGRISRVAFLGHGSPGYIQFSSDKKARLGGGDLEEWEDIIAREIKPKFTSKATIDLCACSVAIGDVSGLMQGMANRFGCKVRGFGEWLAWSYTASGQPTGLMAPRSVVANLKDSTSKKGVFRSLKDLFSHYQEKVIECSPEQKARRVK
jgi:hypothetical protein